MSHAVSITDSGATGVAAPSSPSLILASGSPRRRELLASIGITCQVAPVGIDETPWMGESPEHYVMRMAREKAQAGYQALMDQPLVGKRSVDHALKSPGLSDLASSHVVMGADTALALDGRILGKPRDEADAHDMLISLSGRSHQVLSGVALCHGLPEGGCEMTEEMPMSCQVELVESRVTFRVITAEEASRYWATGEPADKAGGYAIQGFGAVFVSHLEGSYSAVVGLPLHETSQMLSPLGIQGWQC